MYRDMLSYWHNSKQKHSFKHSLIYFAYDLLIMKLFNETGSKQETHIHLKLEKSVNVLLHHSSGSSGLILYNDIVTNYWAGMNNRITAVVQILINLDNAIVTLWIQQSVSENLRCNLLQKNVDKKPFFLLSDTRGQGQGQFYFLLIFF